MQSLERVFESASERRHVSPQCMWSLVKGVYPSMGRKPRIRERSRIKAVHARPHQLWPNRKWQPSLTSTQATGLHLRRKSENSSSIMYSFNSIAFRENTKENAPKCNQRGIMLHHVWLEARKVLRWSQLWAFSHGTCAHFILALNMARN